MAKKVWWTLAWNISQVVSDILKPTDYLILQEQKDSMCADLIKEGKKEPVMSEGKSGELQTIPVMLAVMTHIVQSYRTMLWSEKHSPAK